MLKDIRQWSGRALPRNAKARRFIRRKLVRMGLSQRDFVTRARPYVIESFGWPCPSRDR